jgi:hypothetical protein
MWNRALKELREDWEKNPPKAPARRALTDAEMDQMSANAILQDLEEWSRRNAIYRAAASAKARTCALPKGHHRIALERHDRPSIRIQRRSFFEITAADKAIGEFIGTKLFLTSII